MIASKLTKFFQLTALVLAVAVFNVYVMAAPVRTPTTDPSANQPTSEKVVTEKTGDTPATTEAQAASERMTLTAGMKPALTRIFSKQNVEARAATTSSFLNAKTNFADTFRSPAKASANAQSSGQSNSDESSNTGHRSMWIAVAIIAAVGTIAFIGLRHDRSNPQAASGL